MIFEDAGDYDNGLFAVFCYPFGDDYLLVHYAYGLYTAHIRLGSTCHFEVILTLFHV